jgi:hypothetical protein
LKASRIATQALIVSVVIAVAAACYALIFAWDGPADSYPEDMVAGDVCGREVVGPENVSIAALLANPEKFDGTAVRVIGFYHASFEHSAIYFAESDFVNNIRSNGLWVADGIPSNINNQYILVEGIFSSNDRGHLALWSGSICNVVRSAPWSRGA